MTSPPCIQSARTGALQIARLRRYPVSFTYAKRNASLPPAINCRRRDALAIAIRRPLARDACSRDVQRQHEVAARFQFVGGNLYGVCARLQALIYLSVAPVHHGAGVASAIKQVEVCVRYIVGCDVNGYA